MLTDIVMLQYHDADTLLDGFENNAKRFVKILCEAADDAMPIPDRQDMEEDIYDILYNQVKTQRMQDFCWHHDGYRCAHFIVMLLLCREEHVWRLFKLTESR